MQKIFLSLAMIALTAGLTIGATRAYYTDASEVTGNTFSTGNADLQMTQVYMGHWYASDATATQLAINFPTNLYPGYQGSWGHPDGAMYLGNFSLSPIDLVVKASLSNYSDTNNLGNVVEMAIAWGGTCDPSGVGTGFHTLNWWRSNPTTLFTGADVSCGFIANDHSAGYGGYARALKFYLKVPAGAGNEIQGSMTAFNIHFDAEQKH